MGNKFSAWCYKFDESLVCENSDTKMYKIKNTLSFDLEDLEELAADVEELVRLKSLVENTYTEDDDEYNDLVDEIEKELDSISLEWMSDFVMPDSNFYNVISYDEESKTYEYLQEYPDAYDENLDFYMEKAISKAHDEYEDMQYEIEDDLVFFYYEIIKISELLSGMYDKIMNFPKAWIRAKIDNT